jgi:molybdopterin-containing oxidoreductase family iron-sulfur binding subunit
MGINRRKFLKITGVSTLGAAAVPASAFGAIANPFDWLSEQLGGFTPSETLLHLFSKPAGFKPGQALTGQHWALVVNVKALDEEVAEACEEACHRVHNVPKIENPKHEIKWIWDEEYEHAFPNQMNEFMGEKYEHTPFLVLCNHCENPPCVRVCPTRATFKRKTDGIVMMDMHRCIGCRFCMAACPYGSRSFNWKDPRPYINEAHQNMAYPTRTKGVVEKCQFCAERLAKGLIPACVEASQKICEEKGKEPALVFGDLADPDSEVRHLLNENYSVRRKPELGTGPSVYYIV